MTYQEIIEAIDRLPIQERDSLLRLVSPQPTKQESTQILTPTTPQNEDVIHSIDLDGSPCDYRIEDLIWNPHSYDYIRTQERLFKLAISDLSQEYAGKYVLFEDGRVIDSDLDEDILLDRVCETDFYKQRDAIYYKLVPDTDESPTKN
jgi:hypothetical protein